jgi:hypothetical protein
MNSLTSRRGFLFGSRKLIFRELTFDEKNPDESKFVISASYDRVPTWKLPVYALLRVEGSLEKKAQGTAIKFQIKTSAPNNLFENLFLAGWYGLTLFLPLVFLIRMVQEPGWQNVLEFGIILLLPIISIYLTWSAGREGKVAVKAAIQTLLSDGVEINGIADSPGPDWLGSLEKSQGSKNTVIKSKGEDSEIE